MGKYIELKEFLHKQKGVEPNKEDDLRQRESALLEDCRRRKEDNKPYTLLQKKLINLTLATK